MSRTREELEKEWLSLTKEHAEQLFRIWMSIIQNRTDWNYVSEDVQEAFIEAVRRYSVWRTVNRK